MRLPEAKIKEAIAHPEKLVRQVWREIMACCLDLQVHTDLIMHAEHRPAALTDAMRRRFGCATTVPSAMHSSASCASWNWGSAK